MDFKMLLLFLIDYDISFFQFKCCSCCCGCCCGCCGCCCCCCSRF